MKTLSDFKVGDVILFRTKMRTGEEIRSAVVTDIDYQGNGLVTYSGHCLPDMVPTGSGAFDPLTVGTKPWGLQQVVKHSHVTPWRPWSPKPGDPAYDLTC